MEATAEARFIKCPCEHCGGHISFPITGIGDTVRCPHCGNETALNPNRHPKRGITFTWKVVLIFSALAITGVLIGTAIAGGKQAIGVALGALLFVALSIVALAIYFFPTIVAASREHRNVAGVLLVNLFFGWTLLGWVGALVWAIYQEKR